MNYQAKLVSYTVSLSFVFSPAFLHAQTTQSVEKIQASIESKTKEMQQKVEELALITSISQEAKAKYDPQVRSTLTAGMALFTFSVGNLLYGVGAIETEKMLSAAEIRNLQYYKNTSLEIAAKALEIIKPDITYKFPERGPAVPESVSVSLSKNPRASQELEALVSKFNSNEMRAAAEYIAKERYGNWWVIKKSLMEYQNTSLGRAVARATRRAGAFGLAGKIFLTVAAVSAAGTLWKIAEYNREGGSPDSIDLTPKQTQQFDAAMAQLEELHRSHSDKLLAEKMEAYAQRGYELTARIALLHNEIEGLQKQALNVKADGILTTH